MKLIDLLVKHLAVWPCHPQDLVYQTSTGHLRVFGVDTLETKLPLSEDRGNATSREQWEAARKKWIRNRGVKQCPVLPDRAYQVRFRDGFIAQSLAEENDAMNCIWSHTGEHWDIMAWRYV